MMDLLLATSGGEAQAAGGGYVDDVFSAYTYTGNGGTQTINNGIDLAGKGGLVWVKRRNSSADHALYDTLRGRANALRSNQTTGNWGPSTAGYDLTSFNSDGFSLGPTEWVSINDNTFTYTSWTFRRAERFFDVVCDSGTGVAHGITHGLSAAPEFIIRKSRSGSTQWECWHSALAATEKLVLNFTDAKATDATAWNSTLPTSTQFTVGTGANVNTNAATYVTYLFATLAGISKVGSYTGNGTSQTINCGFATGARFFLVKATSTTGNWWVFDSTRGIVSSFDPALALNSTAAEITSADAVDPDPLGIVVNQEATCSINASGVSYIYLAIA